jgi:uncharacterized protein (TIGR00730 family)
MSETSTPTFRRLCVFCGASKGRQPVYQTTAARLGRTLAEQGIELVYGGGNVGLMGIVANACLDAGGRVIGVIPESLVGREVEGEAVEHAGVTRLEIVDSMHTRKARMAELADGFIALPGGFGTFEELFEILTWAQLGFHQKPIGLLDMENYFAPLLALCDRAVSEGFLRADNRGLLLVESEPSALLQRLREYRPEPVTVWVSREGEL